MGKQNISVSVDNVITYRESKSRSVQILLIKRKNDPYKDYWSLPGGFLEDKEPLEEGAKRELEEETGLKIASLEQLKAFGAPDRDPRGRTISIAFLGETSKKEEVSGKDDAKEAKWFDSETLPELGFDHDEIIATALKRLQDKKQ